jgi:hypothetical protein
MTWLLLAAYLGAAASPAYHSRWVDPAAVLENVPVRFQSAASFEQGGKKTPATQALLLRVRVEPALFLPRDMGPPLFVYGAGACHILTMPIWSDVITILCPRPDDPKAGLWMTPPGEMTRLLTPERMNTLLAPAGPPPKPAATNPLSPKRTAPAERSYADLPALLRELQARPR